MDWIKLTPSVFQIKQKWLLPKFNALCRSLKHFSRIVFSRFPIYPGSFSIPMKCPMLMKKLTKNLFSVITLHHFFISIEFEKCLFTVFTLQLLLTFSETRTACRIVTDRNQKFQRYLVYDQFFIRNLICELFYLQMFLIYKYYQ